jgi:RND family efflux transporter MFP subunit
LVTVITIASCNSNKKESEIKKQNPVSVKLATPIQQTGERIVVSGQIESKEKAVISTRVMGFVSSINVSLGDRVKKGQLLLTVNSSDILAKRAQAQAMLSEAEVALKDAKKDYERFEELFKKQSASAKEFEMATLHYNSLKSKAEAAHQIRNEVDAMLTYTNLTAPFSGVITHKTIDQGSMASPGAPLLQMEQLGNYQVKASVSESEVDQLKMGMSAEISVKSTGKTFEGKISEISPSSHFTGGQFQIKITIPSAESLGLFSGVAVNVSISIPNASHYQSQLIPYSALVHKDQLVGIYTVSENQTALLRWVKVGKKFANNIEILSGLSLGEKFIIESEGKLFSGVPVLVNNQID